MSLPSYVHGASPVALLGETIGANLRRTVDRFGDRDALVAPAQEYRATYRQLWDTTTTLAKALLARGIEKGDRVGIWSPNRFEWVVIQYATARVGAILVNINPAYRLNELEYALKQSGCRWLICAEQFKSSDYHAMLAELIPELADSPPGGLHATRLADLRGVISLGRTPTAGMLGWAKLLGLAGQISRDVLRRRQAQLQFDDPINIQYTSGTTGFPKGATLSHYNILNNGYMVGESLGLSEHDRLVIPVPLYHCFGMVMGNLGCLSHGACVIYPAEGFEPEAVLRAVELERATALYGVPTMFIAELALPIFSDFDLSSLRTGIMAGAPCPIETMTQVNELMHMTEVEIAYGMTETSPVSFQTRVDSPLDKRVSTVGTVHPHVEVKIIDADSGKICSVQEMGELCPRGYSVMQGYWQNPEATATAIDDQGWMHTGDIAVMDSEGYVNIVGRIKDMIVRGGENVYPREIEEFLMTHTAVEAVQVTGVPDPKFGEEIIAWISVKPGAELSEEAVKEFCRGQIAHFKVPRYIRFGEDFPMTVTGKVQKFKMREISIEELGLEEQATA